MTKGRSGRGRDRSPQRDDRNRSNEHHDRERGGGRAFREDNRQRRDQFDNQGAGSGDSHEDRSDDQRDLLVFGRNTVVSYLERMDLDLESEEESAQTQEINKIFLAEGSAPDERIRKIKSLAAKLKIPVVNCHPAKLDSMVQAGGRHQGVAAMVSPIKLLEFHEWLEILQAQKEEFAEKGHGLDGFIVVALDGVEDPRNVGAIIRSAEAQGAHAILIPERRAAQVTETVAKTSAGAIAHIPIVRIVNLVRSLEELKDEGFWILGLAADAPEPIYRMDLKRPLVIVVGSEGKGMRPLVKSTCDLLGAIPLNGITESLNASVALGIAVYESVRQNSQL